MFVRRLDMSDYFSRLPPELRSRTGVCVQAIPWWSAADGRT
ncbi:hypothetical protein [Actinomadura viridis]|uniref:Uncharacterized protein n=1 Tax=Actinomadura viridis TaxID=58110 RepID=A0A931DHS5_9ACTN|nr:hypothetical protein [Actinomadura viridis]MBG6088843.1 hypothetical protein [Actinomadura viridis]